MVTRRRVLLAAPLLAAAVAGVWVWTQAISATALDLPARLTDKEFWQLIEDFSEPNGYFRSDNLVSNEDTFQYVIPDLKKRVRTGGVYLGVGPDQNFTYIAALRPRLVFITDVRRGNLHAQLMYKVLFELSANRAEFVSRLLSRPKPPGLGADVGAAALFAAFSGTRPDAALYAENLEAIKTTLVEKHGFKLGSEDLEGIEYVYGHFFAAGADLAYSNSGAYGRRGGRYPTFQDLQMANDGQGLNHAYLASEANYQVVRTLQQQNLIVPLVGNFAGPKALRAVGTYLKERGATVTAFYTSNVEQYLFQDRIWDDFARNVMALPLDEASTFIRSCFNNCASPYGARSVTLLDSMPGLMKDFTSGRISSYWDVLSHSR